MATMVFNMCVWGVPFKEIRLVKLFRKSLWNLQSPHNLYLEPCHGQNHNGPGSIIRLTALKGMKPF